MERASVRFVAIKKDTVVVVGLRKFLSKTQLIHKYGEKITDEYLTGGYPYMLGSDEGDSVSFFGINKEGAKHSRHIFAGKTMQVIELGNSIAHMEAAGARLVECAKTDARIRSLSIRNGKQTIEEIII